jgi:hypothetical protein
MSANAGVCGDQTKQPIEKRLTNTVQWTMASQEDTFGYDVYRSDSKDGPFVRVTKKPVLGAGTTEETFKYQFVDETANPCADHWYFVEHVDSSGIRSKLTELMRAPAKLLADGRQIPDNH